MQAGSERLTKLMPSAPRRLMPPTVCSIQATLAVLLYSSPMYVALELAMDIDKPVTTRAPFLWAWLEVRKKDSCLSHEGSGNARQKRCPSGAREGAAAGLLGVVTASSRRPSWRVSRSFWRYGSRKT